MSFFDSKTFSLTFTADLVVLLVLFVLCMAAAAALIYNPKNKVEQFRRRRADKYYYQANGNENGYNNYGNYNNYNSYGGDNESLPSHQTQYQKQNLEITGQNQAQHQNQNQSHAYTPQSYGIGGPRHSNPFYEEGDSQSRVNGLSAATTRNSYQANYNNNNNNNSTHGRAHGPAGTSANAANLNDEILTVPNTYVGNGDLGYGGYNHRVDLRNGDQDEIPLEPITLAVEPKLAHSHK